VDCTIVFFNKKLKTTRIIMQNGWFKKIIVLTPTFHKYYLVSMITLFRLNPYLQKRGYLLKWDGSLMVAHQNDCR